MPRRKSKKPSLRSYFKTLLEAHPEWLPLKDNTDILDQWERDNPKEPVTPKIRANLASLALNRVDDTRFAAVNFNGNYYANSRLSRAAMGTVRANVALSIGIKLVFLLLVLTGFGSMWLAVLADVGTSLLVTLNGMRLLRWRVQ